MCGPNSAACAGSRTGTNYRQLMSQQVHGMTMGMCTYNSTMFIFGPLFALPTLTIFAMRQNRMLNLIVVFAYVLFASLSVFNEPGMELAAGRTLFDCGWYWVPTDWAMLTPQSPRITPWLPIFTTSGQFCGAVVIQMLMEQGAHRATNVSHAPRTQAPVSVSFSV